MWEAVVMFVIVLAIGMLLSGLEPPSDSVVVIIERQPEQGGYLSQLALIGLVVFVLLLIVIFGSGGSDVATLR